MLVLVLAKALAMESASKAWEERPPWNPWSALTILQFSEVPKTSDFLRAVSNVALGNELLSYDALPVVETFPGNCATAAWLWTLNPQKIPLPKKRVTPSWNQQNSTLTSSFCWWLDPRFVSKMPGSKWRSGTFPFLAQYRPMYFNLYKCTVTKSYDDPITGTDFWFWKEPAMCFVFLHPAFRLSRVPKKHLAGLPGLYLCLPTSGSNFKHLGHPHPCSSSSSSSSFRIIHDHCCERHNGEDRVSRMLWSEITPRDNLCWHTNLCWHGPAICHKLHQLFGFGPNNISILPYVQKTLPSTIEAVYPLVLWCL